MALFAYHLFFIFLLNYILLKLMDVVYGHDSPSKITSMNMVMSLIVKF